MVEPFRDLWGWTQTSNPRPGDTRATAWHPVATPHGTPAPWQVRLDPRGASQEVGAMLCAHLATDGFQATGATGRRVDDARRKTPWRRAMGDDGQKHRGVSEWCVWGGF